MSTRTNAEYLSQGVTYLAIKKETIWLFVAFWNLTWSNVYEMSCVVRYAVVQKGRESCQLSI